MKSSIAAGRILTSTLLAMLIAACGGGGDREQRPTEQASDAKAHALIVSGAPAAPAWISCGTENVTCTFPGATPTTRRVRYGAVDAAGNPTFYYIRTFTGAVPCNNTTFGDPAHGIVKQCWYESVTATPSTSSAWAKCADWGAKCTFTGSREVRIGTANKYVTRIFEGSMSCDGTSVSDAAVSPADPAPNETKSCWVASATSGVPSPDQIAGRDIVGPIKVTTNGYVIANKHVTSTTGPCIVVGYSVQNVTIRDSEIGPCGPSPSGGSDDPINDRGVSILSSSNVTVKRNVMHDMTTGVFAGSSQHPLVIDRNYIYNIRGTGYAASLIQFDHVRGGTGSTKVTCNVGDGYYTPPMYAGAIRVEDHINMYDTMGLMKDPTKPADGPIEIAYNRIRGLRTGSSSSGSGINVGDVGGDLPHPETGYYYVHDNTVVRVANVGIAVSSGHDIQIENNTIDQSGDQASKTGWTLQVWNWSRNACYNISFSGTKSTVANGWAWNNGDPLLGLYNGGGPIDHGPAELVCTPYAGKQISDPSNDFNNAALKAASVEDTFMAPTKDPSKDPCR